MRARPLLSVSFGLYWLWVFMLLQNPSPLLGSSSSAGISLPLNVLILAANMLTYFLAGLGYRRLNFIGRLKAFPFILVACMCCGTLLFALESWLPLDQGMFRMLLLTTASLLLGASTAGFCLETGRVFGILGPQQVLFHGTFALFWGTLGAGALIMLPAPAQIPILFLIPFVMVFGLYRSMQTLSTNRLYTQGLEGKARVPWKFLFISAFQGLGLGVLNTLVNLSANLPVKPLAVCSFIVATALLFITALSVQLNFEHLVFRVGFPLMAAGFIVISVLDHALIAGSALLYVGYAYMYLINCCLCSYFAKGMGQSPLWIIGLATGSLTVGQAAGSMLSIVPDFSSAGRFAGLMAFVLILAALFMTAGSSLNRGWGTVVPGAEKYLHTGMESACQLVISENSLSKREAEVMLLLLRGRTRRAIGSALGISEETVKTHITNIYVKIAVHSREELVTLVETRAGALES
ncbi:MAG: LuxR family transcriptional regulator [Coriobacteriales bacterium]|nr:LuxR family transcriptional regulator [Coriobacteriales bacterium]